MFSKNIHMLSPWVGENHKDKKIFLNARKYASNHLSL
jgi:hypothetical protein